MKIVLIKESLKPDLKNMLSGLPEEIEHPSEVTRFLKNKGYSTITYLNRFIISFFIEEINEYIYYKIKL